MIGGAFPSDWLMTVDGVTAFVVGAVVGVLYMLVRVVVRDNNGCKCERCQHHHPRDDTTAD